MKIYLSIYENYGKHREILFSRIYDVLNDVCVMVGGNIHSRESQSKTVSKTFVTCFHPSGIIFTSVIPTCAFSMSLFVMPGTMSHFILQSYRRRLSRWRDDAGREGAGVGINAYCDDTYTYGRTYTQYTYVWLLETNFEPIKVCEVVDDVCMLYLRHVRDMEIQPLWLQRADLITSGRWKPCKLEQLLLLYGAATPSIVPVSHITLIIRASLNSNRSKFNIFKQINNDIDTLSISYKNY